MHGRGPDGLARCPHVHNSGGGAGRLSLPSLRSLKNKIQTQMAKKQFRCVRKRRVKIVLIWLYEKRFLILREMVGVGNGMGMGERSLPWVVMAWILTCNTGKLRAADCPPHLRAPSVSFPARTSTIRCIRALTSSCMTLRGGEGGRVGFGAMVPRDVQILRMRRARALKRSQQEDPAARTENSSPGGITSHARASASPHAAADVHSRILRELQKDEDGFSHLSEVSTAGITQHVQRDTAAPDCMQAQTSPEDVCQGADGSGDSVRQVGTDQVGGVGGKGWEECERLHDAVSLVCAMREDVHDAWLQQKGCSLLSALLADADSAPDQAIVLSDTLVEAGALGLVVTLVRTHPSTPALALAACSVLSSCLKLSPAALSIFVKEEGIETLVWLVESNREVANDQALQTHMTAAMRCAAEAEGTRVLEAGGMPTLVTALRAHTGSLVIAQDSCRALKCLARLGTASREAAVRSGAVSALVSALRTHADSVCVQAQGWAALEFLCMDPSAALELVEEGGVGEMLWRLEQHLLDASVAVHCFGLLRLLAGVGRSDTTTLQQRKTVMSLVQAWQGNRRDVVGGLGLLLECMRVHEDCAWVQRHACAVLSCVPANAGHPTMRAQEMRNATGEDLVHCSARRVVHALRLHPDDVHVQWGGCKTLASLGHAHLPLGVHVDEAALLVDVIVKALKRYPGVKPEQYALEILAQMLQTKSTRAETSAAFLGGSGLHFLLALLVRQAPGASQACVLQAMLVLKALLGVPGMVQRREGETHALEALGIIDVWQRVVGGGGVQGVVATFLRHAGCIKIQKICCSVLVLLVQGKRRGEDADAWRQMFIDGGVSDVVRYACASRAPPALRHDKHLQRLVDLFPEFEGGTGDLEMPTGVWRAGSVPDWPDRGEGVMANEGEAEWREVQVGSLFETDLYGPADFDSEKGATLLEAQGEDDDALPWEEPGVDILHQGPGPAAGGGLEEGDSEGITGDDPKADGFVGVLEGDKDLLRLKHDKRTGVKSVAMAALQPVLQVSQQVLGVSLCLHLCLNTKRVRCFMQLSPAQVE